MSTPGEKPSGSPGWLHSLPAIVAVALGAIYALGALNIVGQLMAAGVSSEQALTQFPIEQLLARGIASLISPAALLAVLLLLVLGLASIAEAVTSKRASSSTETLEAESKSSEAPSRRKRVVHYVLHLEENPWAIALFIAALLGLAAPPLLFLSLLLSMSIAVCVMVAIRTNTSWSQSQGWWTITLIWMATVTVSGALASSFLQAKPLPEVILHLRDGKCIEGGLVIDTDNTWFLKDDENEVVAIPSRNIETSRVHYREVAPASSALSALGISPPIQLAGRIVRPC